MHNEENTIDIYEFDEIQDLLDFFRDEFMDYDCSKDKDFELLED